MRKDSSKSLYLDSKEPIFDTDTFNPTPNFGLFTISPSFFAQNPTTVTLKSAAIPYVWGSVPVPVAFVVVSNGVSYPLVLPAGDYTVETLATTITDLITTAGGTSTVAVATDNKLTFTNPMAGDSLTATTADAMRLFGFSEATTLTGLTFTTPPTHPVFNNYVWLSTTLVEAIDRGVIVPRPFGAEPLSDSGLTPLEQAILIRRRGILAAIPINACPGKVIRYKACGSEPTFGTEHSLFGATVIGDFVFTGLDITPRTIVTSLSLPSGHIPDMKGYGFQIVIEIGFDNRFPNKKSK